MYYSYVITEKNILSFYDLGKQFIHNIHLTDEVYESDYDDVRNKRFKSAKLAIEYEVRFHFVFKEPAPNVNLGIIQQDRNILMR